MFLPWLIQLQSPVALHYSKVHSSTFWLCCGINSRKAPASCKKVFTPIDNGEQKPVDEQLFECYNMTMKIKNNGSAWGRQPSSTCAGDESTYTTDQIRTAGISIPFFRRFGKHGLPHSHGALLLSTFFSIPCRDKYLHGIFVFWKTKRRRITWSIPNPTLPHRMTL